VQAATAVVSVVSSTYGVLNTTLASTRGASVGLSTPTVLNMTLDAAPAGAPA
jgi:hypothetical protein